MAVPKFFEFFRSVLQTLDNHAGVMSVKDIRMACHTLMNLSEEDLAQLLPSGRQRTADNRVNWAITYLKKAELIAQQGYGKYSITDEGKKLLATGKPITLNDLEKNENFRAFHLSGVADDTSAGANPLLVETSTPQDMIADAIKQIEADLAEQLLEQIMNQSPKFFENLVVELLGKMGYGGAFDNAGLVVGQTGDEGIDGIIREDKLGFDNIYVQAKRWDPAGNTVGRPEIMQFVGALAGQGASKGLFITTSKFSQQAHQFASKHLQQKIVLVDGKMLTKLMIDYNVGVSTESVHYIKRLDMDFFNN
ncbi:MAG: restriction endonuclease [Clostridia bacterium]|nr:restriction endonuclease [Clostridia bacterium]